MNNKEEWIGHVVGLSMLMGRSSQFNGTICTQAGDAGQALIRRALSLCVAGQARPQHPHTVLYLLEPHRKICLT
jgi:hypothetical protein